VTTLSTWVTAESTAKGSSAQEDGRASRSTGSSVFRSEAAPLDCLRLSCLTSGCPLCRVWSEALESALGSELPCPNCGKGVKLNPFTITADWRPVAKAWRGE